MIIIITSCCLTLNIEESNENKNSKSFQVDLKQNRLRSTKPVVEVSKIDSTRDPQVDSSRLESTHSQVYK